MTNYFRRARSALQELLHGHRGTVSETIVRPSSSELTAPEVIGDNLVADRDGVSFADDRLAGTRPLSWLEAFEAAVSRNLRLSDATVTALRQRAAMSALDELLPADAAPRFVESLRPRPGLSARLRELYHAGILGALLPGTTLGRRADAGAATDPIAFTAIESLERVLTDTSLLGERFGSMLREISAPELVVLALLLHDPRVGRDQAAPPIIGIPEALAPLRLSTEAMRRVEFLLQHQLEMSLLAFRQDTEDPAIVGALASLFSMEEELKMLCLITVADLSSLGPNGLTPWKAELLWRLFVDTYNHMTMSYGDEVIQSHEAAVASLETNRPHDISADELNGFLDGLPRRYLTLFDADNIYRHVRLSRQLSADDVHFVLNKKSDAWELTVVTLDKTALFSNICGVLSYCGFDILRGYAFTSRHDIVLDIFQFTDHKGCLIRPQLDPLLPDVVSGRADIAAMLHEREQGDPNQQTKREPPVIFFDNDSSPRYTILELLAGDAPGLLHRVSRVISQRGCAVDLVLISTQGVKAIDVFHLRKGGAKLTESDALALTEDFEGLFASPPQA
jgi:[protein-PII] uridylyltransferase